MLREPKIETPKPEELKQKNSTTWHTMQCQLVTPMYGGGVQSHTIDKDMPIRVSGIRGQLRFWWRLLAKQKWGLNDSSIRQQEFALWGGNDDKTPQASLVFLKVSDIKNLAIEPWAEYELNHKGKFKAIPTPKSWANVPYALFPAQGKKPDAQDAENPHELAKPNLTWTLEFKVAHNITDTQKEQVIETLRWWANFGGVGSRTRRGLGSVQVTECKNFSVIASPLTANEVAEVGCQLVLRVQSKKDATDAWSDAVAQLQTFRQGCGTGRNFIKETNKWGKPIKIPKRSRWPEPDAIRRLTHCNHGNHKPEHLAGNIFPRAMFGLPIIFHFVGQGEPSDVMLTLADAERMSSPLILRAYYNGKSWLAGALLLPHQAPEDIHLNRVGRQQAQVWHDNAEQNIRPIQDNGGGNPLQAFMQFFAKQ